MTSDHRFYLSLFQPDESVPTPAAVVRYGAGAMPAGDLSYGLQYLANRFTIALNPAWLPKSQAPFEIGPTRWRDGGPIPLTIQDALPDAWGDLVLTACFGRKLSPVEVLMETNRERVGGLVFWGKDKALQEAQQPSAADLAIEMATLEELQIAADQIAQGIEVPITTRRMLNPGASLGGARPKASLIDADELWLAKFAAPADTMDVQLLEAGTLTLAAQCGIRVPEFRLRKIGHRSVLLLRRFDRPGSVTSGHRIHYLSGAAMTNCAYQGNEGSYVKLAQSLREHGVSGAMRLDLEELFIRLLFNLFVDNTDDHIKNHGYLHDGGNRYRLSPVFDVVPQLTNLGYQGIRVKESNNASLEDAMSIAREFGVAPKAADRALQKISDVLAESADVYRSVGLPERDVQQVMACFARQRALIEGRDGTS